MIRVKLYDSIKDGIEEREKQRIIPCRDTRYALTLLHNSRRGIYTDITDFSGYGEDIWSRLAVSATDILIAYDAKRIDGYCPELPIHADYFIENYPYERGTIEVYVRYDSQDQLHKENGEYYTGRYLHELEYHWYRDIGGLIAKSERLIQNAGKRYDYPPREYSVFEFAMTLEDKYANAFEEMEYPCEREYLKKRSLPEQEYRAELEKFQQSDSYREYVFIRDTCKILCYLFKVPGETSAKYPIHLLVRKEPDGRSVMQEICSVKYPTYSEILMYNGIVEFREREDEVYGLVFDAGTFCERADIMEDALWGFRNFGSTIELFDGVRVLVEFVKAVKEAYETGKLYVKHRDIIDGKEVMREERVDKYDSVI